MRVDVALQVVEVHVFRFPLRRALARGGAPPAGKGPVQLLQEGLEVLLLHGLQAVIVDPEPQGPLRVFELARAADDHEHDLGPPLAHGADQLQAGQGRQLDLRKDHVRLQAEDLLARAHRIGAGADQPEALGLQRVRLEEGREERAVRVHPVDSVHRLLSSFDGLGCAQGPGRAPPDKRRQDRRASPRNRQVEGRARSALFLQIFVHP